MTASGHTPETPGGTITAERPDPSARLVSSGVNRRRMLTGSAAVGAVLTGIGALGGPVESAHAQTIADISPSRLRVTDLTHVLHNDFPIYRPYILDPNIFQFASIAEDGFNALKLEIDEHTGTHFDAPWHFNDSPDALHTHEVDPRDLVCPLVVIRISDRAARDFDAQVGVADLRRWERRHGRIPQGALVAMDSGWSARVLQSEEAMLNRGSDGIAHFPGSSSRRSPGCCPSGTSPGSPWTPRASTTGPTPRPTPRGTCSCSARTSTPWRWSPTWRPPGERGDGGRGRRQHQGRFGRPRPPAGPHLTRRSAPGPSAGPGPAPRAPTRGVPSPRAFRRPARARRGRASAGALTPGATPPWPPRPAPPGRHGPPRPRPARTSPG
ncbi:cyclase family protein [Nocardiopsis sp. ARC36]